MARPNNSAIATRGSMPKASEWPMVAVAVDEIILALLEDGGNPHRDGLLPAVQVAEPANALPRLGVFLIGPLLETADEHHHPQPLSLDDAIGFALRRRPVLDFMFNFVGNAHFTHSQVNNVSTSACRIQASDAGSGLRSH